MKNFLLLIAFVLLSFVSQAQQLSYGSNFNETSFVWNPAMTAPMTYWELGATYRQQWLGFEDAPRTATANVQFPFIDRNMSIGAYILHDNTHPLQYNSITFSYSYKIRTNIFDKDQLSIGILGTLSEYHVDSDQIVVQDIDDQLLPGDEASKITPNGGIGIYYQSYAESDFEKTYFYVGMAVNQLLGSDVLFDSDGFPTNFKRALHGNALLGLRFIKDDIAIEPSAWLNFSTPNIYDVNLSLKFENYETFWVGLACSSNLTLGVQGGIILKKGFLKDGLLRIGGLANYNVGRAGVYQGFGYELYLAYRFDQE